MRYYIGIDGGGTKTVCLLSIEDGTIIGRGSAGPSNYQVVGIKQTRSAIEACVKEAIAKSGSQIAEIQHITLGMAGVDRPEDHKVVNQILDTLDVRFGTRIIDNDAVIALAGTTLGRPGVVIICGTGSIAFGINQAGKRCRAGGWGHILGDEGSGYDIGRRAMAAALRDADGRGDATTLKQMLMEHLQLPVIEHLLSRVYRDNMPRHAIAGLAPLVLEAASRGDNVSQDILSHAGSELAQGAISVIRRLGMEQDGFEIGLVGGVLGTESRLTSMIKELTQHAAPHSRVITPRFDPVVGALLLALKLTDQGLTPDIVDNIANSV